MWGMAGGERGGLGRYMWGMAGGERGGLGRYMWGMARGEGCDFAFIVYS